MLLREAFPSITPKMWKWNRRKDKVSNQEMERSFNDSVLFMIFAKAKNQNKKVSFRFLFGFEAWSKQGLTNGIRRLEKDGLIQRDGRIYSLKPEKETADMILKLLLSAPYLLLSDVVNVVNFHLAKIETFEQEQKEILRKESLI